MASKCRKCGAELTGDYRKVFCNVVCKTAYHNVQATTRRKRQRGFRICATCQFPIPADRQAGTLYCSEKCKSRACDARRRRHVLSDDEYARRYLQHTARMLKKQAGDQPSATLNQLRMLWVEQSGRCALTGQPMTLREAQLDHKTPIARGGGHTLDNLRFIHKVPNLMKRDMHDCELFIMCALMLEHAGYLENGMSALLTDCLKDDMKACSARGVTNAV